MLHLCERAKLFVYCAALCTDCSVGNPLPPELHYVILLGMDSSGHAATKRIDRTLIYIETHLGEKLTLDRLAAHACLSKYHFLRVFTVERGETPFVCIVRMRLERAAARLINGNDPITDIAMEVGFSNASSFSRAFREMFGVSPSEYRRVRTALSPHVSSDGEQIVVDRGTIQWNVALSGGNGSVRIERQPRRSIFAVTSSGRYAGNGAFFSDLNARLLRALTACEMDTLPQEVFAVYHDSPAVTGGGCDRVSFGVILPDASRVADELIPLRLEKGLHAVVRAWLASGEYEEAWNWLYGRWLPRSGYVPSTSPPFEVTPFGGPVEERCAVEIHLPVRQRR